MIRERLSKLHDFLDKHENSWLFQIGFGITLGGMFSILLLILKLIF